MKSNHEREASNGGKMLRVERNGTAEGGACHCCHRTKGAVCSGMRRFVCVNGFIIHRSDGKKGWGRGWAGRSAPQRKHRTAGVFNPCRPIRKGVIRHDWVGLSSPPT